MSTSLTDAEWRMAVAPIANRIQLLLDLTIRQVLAQVPAATLDVQHAHLIDRLHQVAPYYQSNEVEVLHVFDRARAAWSAGAAGAA